MCAGRGEGEKVEDVVPRRPRTYVHILQDVIGDVRLYFSLNLNLQILYDKRDKRHWGEETGYGTGEWRVSLQ